MKLQENEIFTNFQFQRQRWQVRFELDYTAAAVLNIQLTDTLSGVVYSSIYSRTKLAANEQLKKHFPALEELFYHLAHHSSTLGISERAVEFEFKKQVFAIQLGKKQMTRDQANEVKIRLLEKRLEKELRQKDEEIKALRQELQRVQVTGGKQQAIEPHPENPDNNGFAYSQGADGLRVKRVYGNTWINFISSREITEKITFKVRLIKLTGRSLCLGVGTKNMFGVHNYHQVEFMNFDFQLNQIAIDGRKINAPCKFENGTVLTMRCDPQTHRLSWFYEGFEIGTVTFPEEVRGRTLYLMAYFKNQMDEIEIWTR